MQKDAAAEAQELLTRVRRLEADGQVNEAITLAREGSTRFPAHYDWAGEIVRLESDGKLARPYREGLEALTEGDFEDAVRLLSWVAGKNPRYLEVSRYLYQATTGRDPEADDEDDPTPPPSLLRGGGGLSAPLVVVLALGLGLIGFALGWMLSPRGAAPPLEAVAQTTPVQEPEASKPAEAAPAEATPAATAEPAAAPAEATPTAPPTAEPAATVASSAEPAGTHGAGGTHAKSSGGSSVSDVDNSDLASQADTLALECQSGSAASCFKVGDSYYFGRGIARDLSAAVRYYTKACDLGEPRGCYNAADMVEKGESVPKDKNKAKTLFGRGCNLGDAQSCSRQSFLEVETTEVP